MARRGMVFSGLLLIAIGVLLPSVAFFNQISDVDLTPFNVVADLSGAKTEATFTSRRSDTYSAFVAMKLPPGADAMMSTSNCLLRNPDTEVNSICKQKGQLTVIASIADAAGGETSLNESDPATGYQMIGGTDVTATRDLGLFRTIAGHRYVIRARFKSDDPTIRGLKPRLAAFVNEPGIYEAIALSRLIFEAGLIIGVIFLAIGTFMIVRAKRKEHEMA